MSDPNDTSAFRLEIQKRLAAAQNAVDQERTAMQQVMVDLQQREAVYHRTAETLLGDVLRPTLEVFANSLDNAGVCEPGPGGFVRCELARSVRFPATAHVALAVFHDDSIRMLTIQYEAHILPVFINCERSDELRQDVDDVDFEAVRNWVQKKLLGFLDSYLQIETHEQYQRDNFAVDPVCGMKVMKPRGLAFEYDGREYYFCAQHCLDRFVQHPTAFLPEVRQ